MTSASASFWLCLCAALPAAAPPSGEASYPLPEGAVARLGHARMVTWRPRSLHVSPDGRWAICNGECFDLVAGRKKPAPVAVPKGYSLHRLFSAGAYVVAGKEDHALLPLARKAIHFTTPNEEPLDQIDFDGRGRFALSVESEKGIVRLADLLARDGVEWKTIASLGHVSRHHKYVHLSDSGSRVVWWDAGKRQLGVYDVAAGKTSTFDVPIGKGGTIDAMALSPDGKRVAMLQERGVWFLDVGTGKQTRPVTVPDFGRGTAGWFTPDGKSVLFRCWDRYVVVPAEGRERPTFASFESSRWWQGQECLYAPLPDSKRVLTADRYGVLRVRDLTTGKQLDSHSRFRAFDGVQKLDGHRVASWSRSGKVVLWDVRNGRVLSEIDLKPPKERVTFAAMEVSRDGRYVAAWTGEEEREHYCVLAEAATGKVVVEPPGFVAFHPFGKAAVLQHPRHEDDQSLYAYFDLARREWGQRVELPDGENHFSQDGRTILGADDDWVTLAEVATGKARWQAKLPNAEAKDGNRLCLSALSRSGRRAFAVRRRDAVVLDAVNGRTLFHFELTSEEKEADRVAAVSASGRWLAVMADGLRLYDLDAEKPSGEVKQHLPVWDVTAMALDADGSRLITAHGDGTCLVWDTKKLALPEPRKKAVEPWELLGSPDPSQAQSAIAALMQDEAKAVALFAKKLTPAVEVAPAKIGGWIADLDAEDFDRRTAAERDLAAAGDQAEAALRKAAAKPASAEQRRQIERLLRRLNPKTDPTHLRHLRALEILERIGSKEAVALLQKLTKGAPAARLTREANESLERLKRSEDQ